jgi:hypothetical protein
MDEPRPDSIEELLEQSERAEARNKIEMNRLRADQLLAAIAVLEGQMTDVNELVEKEIRLLEQYISNELARLDKKRSWLLFNLEGFMRTSGEKTLRLPHGILKLRKGRDKAVIVALEEFMKVGPKLGLVRSIPESVQPDTQAILNRIKATGDIPEGVQYIPADVRFSYTITDGGKEDESKQREWDQSSKG